MNTNSAAPSTWLGLVSDTKAIDAIYGDEPPPLSAVSIHEIRLLRDGPTAHLTFDLRKFPSAPPRKWQSQGFNTVQLTLEFFGILDVHIDRIGTEMIADIALVAHTDGVQVSVRGPNCSLEVVSSHARLSKISAYLGSTEQES